LKNLIEEPARFKQTPQAFLFAKGFNDGKRFGSS
jgi:hypothetical protein